MCATAALAGLGLSPSPCPLRKPQPRRHRRDADGPTPELRRTSRARVLATGGLETAEARRRAAAEDDARRAERHAASTTRTARRTAADGEAEEAAAHAASPLGLTEAACREALAVLEAARTPENEAKACRSAALSVVEAQISRLNHLSRRLGTHVVARA